jgi:biotin transport system substrate-specific component
MDLRGQSAMVLEQIERAMGGPLLALAALAISIILLVALLVLAGRHVRLVREVAERERAMGTAIALSVPQAEQIRTSVDRLLPRNPVAFYLFVTLLAAACWLVGWAIAPSTERFLASREWHIQPFYLAVHLIALRLFVRLFVRKYVAGAAQLDIPAERVAAGIRRVLGPTGGYLAGFVVAAGVAGLAPRRGEPLGWTRGLFFGLLGLAFAYAFGVAWLAHVLHLGARQALLAGFVPFVGPDIVKAVVAVVVARHLRAHRLAPP